MEALQTTNNQFNHMTNHKHNNPRTIAYSLVLHDELERGEEHRIGVPVQPSRLDILQRTRQVEAERRGLRGEAVCANPARKEATRNNVRINSWNATVKKLTTP